MKKLILPLLVLGLVAQKAAFGEAEPYAVITDDMMHVIYSEYPSVAAEGDQLNLLISPYPYQGKRIALLMDESGEIIRCFIAKDAEHSLGEGSAEFEAVFPKIGQNSYERGCALYDELGGLTGDLWYYLVKDIKLTKKERLRVVDFVNWVKDREDEAKGDSLTVEVLPGGKVYLFYFIESN